MADDITSAGGVLITLSSDPWEHITARDERRRLGEIALADPDAAVISAWGLEHAMGPDTIARPASFLVGPDGRIAWRHLPHNWRYRLSAEEYLAAFREHRRPAP